MSTASSRRNPLIISGNSLSSGDRSMTFSAERPDSLLRSYLILVRDLRGQRREPGIELRTEDVHVIAAHLGVSDQLVLGGLLDLMGATRVQRNAMSAMLAAGALTLVLTGSIVTDLSTDGISVEMDRLAAVVRTAVQSDDGTVGPAATADGTTVADSAMRAVPDGPAESRPTAATPSSDALRSVAAATRASIGALPPAAAGAASATPVIGSQPTVDGAPESVIAPIAGEPVSIGVTSDGSLVASVAPPTPTTTNEPVDGATATAQLPDGTTVGVAAPPIPPPPTPTTDQPADEPADQPTDQPSATAQLPDGTTVGVAAPPLPPTGG